MENNLRIDDIIEMGGHVELTGPLLVFIEDEKLDEELGIENQAEKLYALVGLSEKSKIQITKRELNRIEGIIIEANTPMQVLSFEHGGKTEFIDPIEVNNKSFVTSWLDLEDAIKIRRGRKQ